MKHFKLSIKTTAANSISRALHLDKSAAILTRDSWAQRTRYTASFNRSIPCLGNPVSYQTNSTRSSLQLVFTTPLQLLPKKIPRKSTGPSVAHKKTWVENKSLIYSWFYTYHPRVKNYCSKKFELPRLGFWYSMWCHGHSSQVALQNGHGSTGVWFNVNNIDLLPYFTNRTLKQNWLEALHDVVATWCFFSIDASYSRSKQKKMVSFFDHFGGF